MLNVVIINADFEFGKRMDWDRLRIFLLVANEGSLTDASKRLNLSQSSISRQIKKLEDSLKVVLFHRHPRGLLLTEQGELLFKSVNKIYLEINSTLAKINDSKETAFGEPQVIYILASFYICLLYTSPSPRD